jgi:hypothetical protein
MINVIIGPYYLIKISGVMLTDLGSNCFGDANIGPLCFLSTLSWILLSWVEMLFKKQLTWKKGV